MLSDRDYLAMHAPHEELYLGDTTKWCADKLGMTVEEYAKVPNNYHIVVAITRYEWADAMLKVGRGEKK